MEEGSPHQGVEEGDPAHHEVGGWGDPYLVEECDLQLQEMVLCSSEMEMKSKISIIIGTFSRILFSQTNTCASRTISFLSFHTFFIVHRSVLTVKNLMKVKAQQCFKKFHW